MPLVGSGRFPAIVPSGSGGRVARAAARGIGKGGIAKDLNYIPRTAGVVVEYLGNRERNSKPALPVGKNSSPAPVPAGNAEEKKEEEKPPLR